MAFLKFNKAELVNLSYSLKREIILANKTGAYCNTSIITCNTRRYHGLLAVTLDRFGGGKFLLLSDLDETLIVDGKQFNLGIHCYGDIYEPRGHKYIVDFTADPVPQITYKVGQILLRKTLVLAHDADQVLVRYELLQAPSATKLQLRPFLAFRNIHALTSENPAACPAGTPIPGGCSFKLYPGFPELNLQTCCPACEFREQPYWYKGVTYSDEYRRGFDCREDLMVPGWFECPLEEGDSIVFSASIIPGEPALLERRFEECITHAGKVANAREQLERCADLLICNHNGRKKITAGFSWMDTGLLRETLLALPGLTLYRRGGKAEFEQILDNLIADEQERLFRRTTQVEAPLLVAVALQKYIAAGASPEKVWRKYGIIVRGILESYLPGERKEVAMQPDGLLWAQMEGAALSWMNAYIDGRPVTERAGYQVETNALWYNAICFALGMEASYGETGGAFNVKWEPVRDLVRESFRARFWNPSRGFLADYVDASGPHWDVRPNQLIAVWVDNSPLDEEVIPSVLRVVDRELVTRRGIRTLSPRDERYKGVYEGTQIDRDLAYHQGSTRPFLLEYYIETAFRIRGAAFAGKAEWLVEGFYEDLGKHGVGAFSELYDGDPPHEPHGAISSALSTAALLSIDRMIGKYKEDRR